MGYQTEPSVLRLNVDVALNLLFVQTTWEIPRDLVKAGLLL